MHNDLAQYISPGKESRQCPYWWFDAWDRLVNGVLSIMGTPMLSSPDGWFCIDPHVHTMYSKCSISHPEKLLLRASQMGLKAVAVMDHNNPQGAAITAKSADYLKSRHLIDEDFIVIPGQEVNTNRGHLGALFTDAKFPIDQDPEVLVRQIHEDGGLVVAVHPFHSSGVGDVIYDLPIDLIEVDCGAVFDRDTIIRAQSILEEPRLSKVGKLGSSDSHYINALGSCYTLVKGDNINLDSIRNAFISGETKSVPSPFHARVRHLLGKIGKLR